MATIALQIKSELGGIASEFEMSDADMARILMAYGVMFGQVVDGETQRDRTQQEVVDRLATDLIQQVKSNVREFERVEAIKRLEVPEIVFTAVKE